MPVAAPIAVGENVTPTVQLAPAATLDPQVLLATAKPALVAMLEKLSGDVFVIRQGNGLGRAGVADHHRTEAQAAGGERDRRTAGPGETHRLRAVQGAVGERQGAGGGADRRGENVTPTVQLAPAAMLVPQVLLAIAKPALATMLEKFRATLPRFVRVTVLAALVLPTATVPKFKLLEENVTGALPVPVRLTVCVPALSVIVRVPEAEPIAVGVNETEMVQEAPGAMLAVQVLVWLKGAVAVTLATCMRPCAGVLQRDGPGRAGGAHHLGRERKRCRSNRSDGSGSRTGQSVRLALRPHCRSRR